MRKKFVAIFAVVVLLVCFMVPTSVFAAGLDIYSTKIDIELLDDGSAIITEVWDVRTTDGTEFYLAKPMALKGQAVSGLSVIDETGKKFKDVGSWNSSLSASEKTGKSGIIVKGDSYELCWGIGEYGKHTYTISYVFTGLVQSYNGADALYQYLIPPDMPQPKSVSIVVRNAKYDLESKNTGIWAFGFTGNAQFENGKVLFDSTSKLSSSNYVVVLMELAPGMLHPSYVVDRDFEDLKEEAMEGSNYNPGGESGGGTGGGSGGGITTSRGNVFFGFLFFAVMGSIISFVASAGSRLKKFEKPKKQDIVYSRELPFNNDLASTHFALKNIGEMKDEGIIIGVYILRWMQSGLITIWVDHTTRKNTEHLVLNQPMYQMDPIEGQLYSILQRASGADGMLSPKEMERWGKTNYKEIESWFTAYNKSGEKQLISMDALAMQESKILGFIPIKSIKETPIGSDLCLKMLGFKKYLEEFTIINERRAVEVELWKDYLVYAQLFGIADTVYAQFTQLYPAYFTQPQTYSGGTGMSMYNYAMVMSLSRSFSRSAYSGYRSGYNAANSSYSGGGGGFSGGGGSSGGGGGGGGGTR